MSFFTQASTVEGSIPGQTKKGVDGKRETYVTNCLALTPLFGPVTISSGQAATTVSAILPLPSRIKIPQIAIGCTAIQSVSGSHSFNIVLGTGTYETAGVQASQTATLAGTPNHDGTVTTTVNGTAVVYTEVSGDTTVTLLAGHVVAAINANTTVNKLVFASNVAGVITLTALPLGTAGNGITLTVATTDSAATYVAGGATLTGGTAATGVSVPQNDNSSLAGGGFCTNPATTGQAMFATDVAINSTNTPGIATTGGSAVLIPNNFPLLGSTDAVWPRGGLLTLRVVSPASVGSITNLVVYGVTEIQPLSGTFPSQNILPGLGVPFPSQDF